VFLVLGAIFLLVAGSVLFDLLRPEPACNGRRLSGWLNDFVPYAQQSGANQDQAVAAVQSIGARGIPVLLRWMNSEDNSAKKAIYQMLPRNLQLRWQPQWAFDRWWSAAKGFEILGTNGVSAMPELSRLLGVGKRGQPAAAALAGIGEPAFHVLTNLFLQEASANDAAYGLTRFGEMALPTFIHALANTNQTVHRAAFAGLRFSMNNAYIWKDPNPSRGSLLFNTTAISAAMVMHAGRQKTLLAQTLDQCLVSTNQEVAITARIMKTQLGL
jgi:hypothetical protein